jgi:hypothetical protein
VVIQGFPLSRSLLSISLHVQGWIIEGLCVKNPLHLDHIHGLWISQLKIVTIYCLCTILAQFLIHIHIHVRISYHAFSLLFTTDSVQCVWGFLLLSQWLCWKCIASVAAMSGECSCSSTACKRKDTNYNFDVKLEIYREQRGKHVIGIYVHFKFLKWQFILFWRVCRKLK